ncbi:hypothetical protein [Absidia glauca]|uniref:Velvet domain-containing protein n=1 Tax=Absidia glauca TaxID=4829 RepID=A0A163JQ22_ABSGL|nr:hypothetical protein [Absidia glauca]
MLFVAATTTCIHRRLFPSCHSLRCSQHDFLHNPYFFLYANLTSVTDDADLYIHHGHRTTAGAVVQSLHKLKDPDNNAQLLPWLPSTYQSTNYFALIVWLEGGFFVFADISVRLEGNYRLKFTLFEIVGEQVQRWVSVISDPFTVYSPKYFPGMSESSLLTRSFSDQGVRIRIRKDTRTTAKRQKLDSDQIKTEENLESEKSPSSPLILPHLTGTSTASSRASSRASNITTAATSPAPSQRSSAMSMQNILSPSPI